MWSQLLLLTFWLMMVPYFWKWRSTSSDMPGRNPKAVTQHLVALHGHTPHVSGDVDKEHARQYSRVLARTQYITGRQPAPETIQLATVQVVVQRGPVQITAHTPQPCTRCGAATHAGIHQHGVVVVVVQIVVFIVVGALWGSTQIVWHGELSDVCQSR